jgi:hypothetical protein
MRLLIATPEYTPALPQMRASRAPVVADLRAHGHDVIEQSAIATLICEARDALVSDAYRFEADAILWWDGDIECMTPTCVGEMIYTKKDIIGCAVPSRAGGLNIASRGPRTREGVFLPVDRIGAAFLLTRMSVFDRIREAHPERALRGGFAYFHTPIVDGARVGEDYTLCDEAASAGIQAYAYVPAICRHWCMQPLEGSLSGMLVRKP